MANKTADYGLTRGQRLETPTRDSLTVFALRRLAASGASLTVLQRVAGGPVEWSRLAHLYRIERPTKVVVIASPVVIDAGAMSPKTVVRLESRARLNIVLDAICAAFSTTAARMSARNSRDWRASAAFLVLAYELVPHAETKAIARTIGRQHSTLFSHLRQHRHRLMDDPVYAVAYKAAEAAAAQRIAALG